MWLGTARQTTNQSIKVIFHFHLSCQSKLLETHVRAQVVYKKTAPDGEVESIVQKELTVSESILLESYSLK